MSTDTASALMPRGTEDDAKRIGLYFDGWAAFGFFDNKVNGEALPTVKYNSRLVTLSIESGYAFKPTEGKLVLEPQAQLLYTHYDQDNVQEVNGTRINGTRRRPADESPWRSDARDLGR